jgi:ABC-2 type transport system ATP-binding protein
VRLTEPRPDALGALAGLSTSEPVLGPDGRTLVLAVDESPGLASQVVAALADVGVAVDEVAVHRPSLDDVFFHLTGHAATEDLPGDPAGNPTDEEAA